MEGRLVGAFHAPVPILVERVCQLIAFDLRQRPLFPHSASTSIVCCFPFAPLVTFAFLVGFGTTHTSQQVTVLLLEEEEACVCVR